MFTGKYKDPSGLKHALAEARAEIERLTAELEQMTAIKDIHQRKRHEYFERSEKAEAEIARLTKERQAFEGMAKDNYDRLQKAEAERDEARAQVAAAYEAATSICANQFAALEAYGREKVREGMKRAAGLIAKRRDDYISEFGSYDPTTGVTKFPGNGDEYVYELNDCEATILAEMRTLK